MFITFEGVEGCGKTTQAQLLAGTLESRGQRTFLTREPGGATISERIRAVLLDPASESMEPWTEALLYEAARAQFVAEVVKPRLAAGYIVICDRYADSTLAYQGYGRGLSLDTLRTLNEIAMTGTVPDLTLLVDVSVQNGLARRHRGGDVNRLDLAGDAFHERVRNGYDVLAREDPIRWRKIDGTGDIASVEAAIWAQVVPLVARLSAATR